jgi:hypothetical protein
MEASNWTDPRSNDYIEAESLLLDKGRVFFAHEENARAFSLAFPVNSGGHRCTEPKRNRDGTYTVLRIREGWPMTVTFDRPLSEDERGLVKHIGMWGSQGYPVRKAGRQWTWRFCSLEAPALYKTKREATAAFETYMGVLYDCLRADSYRRALAELGRPPLSFCCGERQPFWWRTDQCRPRPNGSWRPSRNCSRP